MTLKTREGQVGCEGSWTWAVGELVQLPGEGQGHVWGKSELWTVAGRCWDSS